MTNNADDADHVSESRYGRIAHVLSTAEVVGKLPAAEVSGGSVSNIG